MGAQAPVQAHAEAPAHDEAKALVEHRTRYTLMKSTGISRDGGPVPGKRTGLGLRLRLSPKARARARARVRAS